MKKFKLCVFLWVYLSKIFQFNSSILQFFNTIEILSLISPKKILENIIVYGRFFPCLCFRCRFFLFFFHCSSDMFNGLGTTGREVIPPGIFDDPKIGIGVPDFDVALQLATHQVQGTEKTIF